MEIRPFKFTKLSVHFSDIKNDYQIVFNKEKTLVRLFIRRVENEWNEVQSKILLEQSPEIFRRHEMLVQSGEIEDVISLIMAIVIAEKTIDNI